MNASEDRLPLLKASSWLSADYADFTDWGTRFGECGYPNLTAA